MDFVIRNLTEDDAVEAHTLQTEVYDRIYWDPLTSYQNGLKKYPQCHYGAFYDGKLAGYFIFKPWKGEYTIENNKCGPVEQPEYMYLSDMAIRQPYRGKGLAKMFLEIAYAKARELGLNYCKGIAVQGAEKIWEHCGFKVVKSVPYGAAMGWWIEKEI
jgi:GNAT superfamily N-acetyltransferase